MSSLRSVAAVAALALTALTAGCSAAPGASPSGSTGRGGIAYPTGANDLVIRLRYVGGFAPPSAHILDLPVVAVYGDGTAIVPGAVPAIYPGPALPNLQRATITPAGMQRLLEAAREAGVLGPDAHYDLGGIMDASSAEFTVDADGRVHTVSAYALAESGGRPAEVPPGTDPEVTAARARLSVFMSQLTSLEAFLGDDVGEATPYEATAVQLLVSNGAPIADQGLEQQPIEWPLEVPLATFGQALPQPFRGERCGVVTGEDVALLMPLLQGANTLSPWTDDGAAFGLAVRPLLPDEAGCPAIEF